MMAQVMKRGILQAFDATTYTATVLLLEATSASLAGVPVANQVDGTSALVGCFCAVLFFDEHNPADAVVIATYPNTTQGVPAPPPGRMTLVAGFQQINAVLIPSGTTQTFTLTGAGGIPAGARAVLCKAFFTSPSVPSHIDLAAHGGNLSRTMTVGDLQNANKTMQGMGVLPVDGNGQVDIKANGGDCTVTLSTYGYVV